MLDQVSSAENVIEGLRPFFMDIPEVLVPGHALWLIKQFERAHKWWSSQKMEKKKENKHFLTKYWVPYVEQKIVGKKDPRVNDIYDFLAKSQLSAVPLDFTMSMSILFSKFPLDSIVKSLKSVRLDQGEELVGKRAFVGVIAGFCEEMEEEEQEEEEESGEEEDDSDVEVED
jgi:hypothetical protein